jgi:diketogulonate reductase-like aldo/keto reductase
MTSATIEPFWMYGTAWKEDDTARLTRLALEKGFRAIDTANQRKHYFEAAVGEALDAAIADGLVTRDDVFLQTKFTHQAGQDHRLPYDPKASLAEQVEQSCASSLEHLQVDTIDSYILHGPSTRAGVSEGDLEVWRAMEQLHRDGKVRHLGVSNVSAEQLAAFVDAAEVPISFAQIRTFAATRWGAATRAICDANDITYQGFSLLTANVREVSCRAVADIAERHDATIPQVVFAFAHAVGMLPLTGTTDAQHMEEDLASDTIELSDIEVQTILDVAG